jgi:hypothetical protein
VNTRPVSCHISPAFSWPAACAALRWRRASTAIWASRSVRRDFGVLVSPPVRSLVRGGSRG